MPPTSAPTDDDVGQTAFDVELTKPSHVTRPDLRIKPIDPAIANTAVIQHHYLHRAAPISYAYGAYHKAWLLGVVTYGTPPSRHLQKSACPTNPALVLELNRLWLDDLLPANTESWFVARTLKLLPARIIVSYADPKFGHYGYIYRALNFHYAGWTDMERPTPRLDYIPADPTKHTRDAFRNGQTTHQIRRIPKVKYWTVSGPTRRERQRLEALCPWPRLDWKTIPPPNLES